jgi:hypothetical protein
MVDLFFYGHELHFFEPGGKSHGSSNVMACTKDAPMQWHCQKICDYIFVVTTDSTLAAKHSTLASPEPTISNIPHCSILGNSKWTVSNLAKLICHVGQMRTSSEPPTIRPYVANGSRTFREEWSSPPDYTCGHEAIVLTLWQKIHVSMLDCHKVA